MLVAAVVLFVVELVVPQLAAVAQVVAVVRQVRLGQPILVVAVEAEV
jgi:hypothetical protein